MEQVQNLKHKMASEKEITNIDAEEDRDNE